MNILFIDRFGRDRALTAANFDDCITAGGTHGMRAETNRKAMWTMFCEVYDGAPNAFDNFIMRIARGWVPFYEACARQLIEDYYGDDDTPDYMDWAAFRRECPKFDTLYREHEALKKWLRDKCNKRTFKTNRLTMAKIAHGESYTWEVDVPKIPAKKGEKQKTAGAKNGQRKAQGAPVDTPETGATTLEKIAGDRDLAAAAIVQALKAFPDLATKDKTVVAAIDKAVKDADRRANNVAAARRKKA